ncbi:MAG: response regulator transcription factor [Acidimicrobiia bacterium]
MNDATIMVVEDDPPLRSALVSTLRAQHYATIESGSAEETLLRLDGDDFDLVLLDLALPGMDGLDLLARLRTVSAVPVIVLTVRDGKADKLVALDAGADDYVTKPFDSDELLARIRAALRRRPESSIAPVSVEHDRLEIDRARGVVKLDGEPVKLTATEWKLLELLISSEGRLLTYRTLSRELRGGADDLDAKALRVYIGHLRRKLGDDAADPTLILTHFGLGVRWIADER